MIYWVKAGRIDVDFTRRLQDAKGLVCRLDRTVLPRPILIEAYRERNPGTGGPLVYTLGWDGKRWQRVRRLK